MEPKFSGPAYTVGIEEELMILDGTTYALVNAIDDLVEESPHGEIKPELMESVLEISTNAAADLRAAVRMLRGLRRQVRD
jgi:carboxylate-amine ligase